ncbi:MAG: hypothetical protein M1822_009995 [Bathelium mastoideum]|nr:MAG: hypothetical protein M1822_009995 [Bathelium mastoideum]
MGGPPEEKSAKEQKILASATYLPIKPVPSVPEKPANKVDYIATILKNIEDNQQAVRYIFPNLALPNSPRPLSLNSSFHRTQSTTTNLPSTNIINHALTQVNNLASPSSHPPRDPALMAADNDALISGSSYADPDDGEAASTAPAPPVVSAVQTALKALEALETHERSRRSTKARVEEALQKERRVKRANEGWGSEEGKGGGEQRGDGSGGRRGSAVEAVGVDRSRDPRLKGR